MQADAQQIEVDEPPRRKGRPKRGSEPSIPWKTVERLLVYGERVADARSGRRILKYPSYRELGRRYGVCGATIVNYAREHNCLKRRKEFLGKEEEKYHDKLAEALAEARALDATDVIQVIDGYLRKFAEALERDEIRVFTAADFNTMARLREFLLGHADSRREVNGTLTLRAVQERHHRFGSDRKVPKLAAGVEPIRDLIDEATKAVMIEGVAEPVSAEAELAAASEE